MKFSIGTAGLVDSNKIECAEIEFTRGVNLTKDKAEQIRTIAKRNNLILSVHAPYFINLNSTEVDKVKASIKRIIDSAIAAKEIGAEKVVFHPGYYTTKSKTETYDNIRDNIAQIQDYLDENNISVELLPETTGKLSQFGSLPELVKLHDDIGINFCIDFAHIYAYHLGRISYVEIVNEIQSFKNIHSHFSGIEFGARGELRHLHIKADTSIKLIEALHNSALKRITMISESPLSYEDALLLIDQRNKLQNIQ